MDHTFSKRFPLLFFSGAKKRSPSVIRWVSKPLLLLVQQELKSFSNNDKLSGQVTRTKEVLTFQAWTTDFGSQ